MYMNNCNMHKSTTSKRARVKQKKHLAPMQKRELILIKIEFELRFVKHAAD